MTRLERLRRHQPLCAHCEREGRVTEAVQWDHTVPLWEGGRDHESNMLGLCRVCHLTKSRAEAKRRAAAKRADVASAVVGSLS